jgi:hypothetical protein
MYVKTVIIYEKELACVGEVAELINCADDILIN